jgi:hypothetical protein
MGQGNTKNGYPVRRGGYPHQVQLTWEPWERPSVSTCKSGTFLEGGI